MTFTWEPEGTQQVTLEVARDSAFTAAAGRTVSAGTGAVMNLPAGSYYWRLVDGKGKAGPVRKFTIVADSPVMTIAPAGGQQYSYKEKMPFIVFRWKESGVSHVLCRRYQQRPGLQGPGPDPGQRQGLNRHGQPTGRNLLLARPQPVRFQPGSLHGQPDPSVRHFAGPRPPGAGTAPPEGRRHIDRPFPVHGQYIFNWRESGDYAGYDFRIARDKEFRSVVYRIKTEANFHKPRISLEKGTYYWSVSGVTAAGATSLRSGTRAFTIAKAQPPGLLGPESGAAINSIESKEIRFRWSGVNAGQRYRFELSRDRDFRKLLRGDTVSEPSQVIAMPAPGNYFWRVRVLDDAGGTVLASSMSAAFQWPRLSAHRPGSIR